MLSETILERHIYLRRNLLLLLPRKVDEVVVFGAYQQRNGRLVEASALTVPFFDGIESAFACEVEHKQ